MKLTCDVQECEGQLAVVHCVECGDNYCDTHQQNHKSLYSKRHMEVTIQVYEQSPETFGKPICEQHQETLVRACQKCDKLVCCECDIDEEDCTADDAQSKLSLRLVDIPSSLECISEHYTIYVISGHDTKSNCYSANQRQDGDILIGTKGGVHLLSRDDKKLTKYNTPDKRVSTVIEYHNNIYILHRVGSTEKVEMCLPDDITKRQELFQFERTGTGAAAIAVSDRFIVVKNPDTLQLIIYNRFTKQTNTIHPVVYAFGMQFLPDGHLLGVGSDKLIKYRIENGELSTVWICEGLVNGYSVCADSNGLIYVCTNTKQTVYIISADAGVKLRELTYDKLPSVAGYISVKDGVLAVPGWEDKKLHLFKINRGVNKAEQ